MLSDPKIVEVVISILSERGYAVTMDERVHETPKRVDPKTWEIILERYVYVYSHGTDTGCRACKVHQADKTFELIP